MPKYIYKNLFVESDHYMGIKDSIKRMAPKKEIAARVNPWIRIVVT